MPEIRALPLPLVEMRQGWGAVKATTSDKNHASFTNVLKKFFTTCFRYENKEATETEDNMLSDIKTILTRSRATLIEDATGVAVLFTFLLIGLHLSGAA
jgi:hypothetical protein